ncbi:MAG: RDD family protein [Gammaproteobacteria bacterium]|nr:RDD family protein [Gammaproteobacteria bacterium]
MNSQPAGFIVRVMAMIYDALVVLGIWVFTIVILVTIRGDAVIGAWVQSLLFIELFAFFTYFWIKRGQTVGMLAWRLRIVSTEPMSLRRVLLRFIGALLGAACLFLGYVWILFDGERRSWSDLLSGTQVVRDPKPPKPS